jgi:XTP/dITP diphosphohydrolase
VIKIVLATHNLHKVREFREMFRPLTHLELLSLHPFHDYHAPEETGHTFKENAILKAMHAASHLHCWALADDSGLVVPALQGAPGVYSRRYVGLKATDGENSKKLLQQMSLLQGEERVAYYECALALASPDGLKKCVEGICEGSIALEPRGRHGFGYDPLFIKNGYEKTFGELDEAVKNRISHRRKAFDRLINFLDTLREEKPPSHDSHALLD